MREFKTIRCSLYREDLAVCGSFIFYDINRGNNVYFKTSDLDLIDALYKTFMQNSIIRVRGEYGKHISSNKNDEDMLNFKGYTIKGSKE